MQDLNTAFPKICMSPRPSGAPMAKASLTVIKKGANPEKTARHGYEKTCDLMQQKAIACQSKAFAHMSQRTL